jgi:hypothetical protein
MKAVMPGKDVQKCERPRTRNKIYYRFIGYEKMESKTRYKYTAEAD